MESRIVRKINLAQNHSMHVCSSGWGLCETQSGQAVWFKNRVNGQCLTIQKESVRCFVLLELIYLTRYNLQLGYDTSFPDGKLTVVFRVRGRQSVSTQQTADSRTHCSEWKYLINDIWKINKSSQICPSRHCLRFHWLNATGSGCLLDATQNIDTRRVSGGCDMWYVRQRVPCSLTGLPCIPIFF